MSESIHRQRELTPEVLAARERFLKFANKFLPEPELLAAGQSERASFNMYADPSQLFQANRLVISHDDEDQAVLAEPKGVNIARTTSIGVEADMSGLRPTPMGAATLRISHDQGGPWDGEFVMWYGERDDHITDVNRVHRFLEILEAAAHRGSIAKVPNDPEN